MPIAAEAVRSDLLCGVGPDGRWHGWFEVRVHADALRTIGLHPEQASAVVNGSSPPGWWHAEAERRARR
ncbi:MULTISPECIES: hypothetical protein [Streptomycetaceae]|uniref:hypothetical protein n=1 Tax=Streptomycetaceae TaxID=2062 RepID=UPI00093CB388|nr:hypothetical protein [Streptomyces sp. CB02056]OKI05730.1 hypothetical protein AMK13_20685 [Streptomyces sp. CB02056]